MLQLIPRDKHFFAMFAELAKRLTAASRLLGQLFEEPHNLDHYVGAIKKQEHEADAITHDIIQRINQSLVTPIDREDIYLLASSLDNVIDLLDGTARRVAMFHIRETREPARRLTQVLIRAAGCIEAAVLQVKNPQTVSERARDIKRCEEEGDAIYHEAIGGLFAGSPDPLDVIKWKELYDTLEGAIDECEDVANVLETISIKHA